MSSSFVKDTLEELPIEHTHYSLSEVVLRRIAINLAEIAEQLGEMNGYVFDTEDNNREKKE